MDKSLIFRFLLILFLFLLVPSISTATDWTYYIDIELDSTDISGDQSNFVVLVYEDNDTNNQLDDAFWGHVRSDGLDIVFTPDTEDQFSTGDTKYDREVVFTDTTNQKLQVWVEVPIILAVSGAVIRMWYGGDLISNTTGTWNSMYEMVIHMKDDGGGDVDDSTSNGNDGTAINQAAEDPDGQIGKCFTFDGTSDSIDFSDIAAVTGISTLTISGWFKTPNNGNGSILTKFDTGTDGSFYIATIVDAVRFATVTGSSSRVDSNFTVTDYNDDEWHYVTGVYDGSDVTAYYEGQPNTPISQTGNIKDTIYDVRIGMFMSSSTFDFDGEIDEVRILTDVVDDDWIDTEYNNQISPDDFYTSGSEQSPIAVGYKQLILVN